MSNNVTMARPYAKAIFEHAHDKQTLLLWSSYLHVLSTLVADKGAQSFIKNPSVNTSDQVSLLLKGLTKLSDFNTQNMPEMTRMLNLLAINKRLLLLADIAHVFESMKADAEKTLTVQVKAFAAYTAVQAEALQQALSKRLSREVTLEMSVDKALLGGAVIYAGDLVIDLSMRNQLNKLRQQLATLVPAVAA